MTDVAPDLGAGACEAGGIEIVKPFTDRKEERVESNLRAVIRLHDNTEIACCIRDVSKSGARLGIPRGCLLPKAFMIMIDGRDFIFQVRLAWQREPYAGVHIERIARRTTNFPK